MRAQETGKADTVDFTEKNINSQQRSNVEPARALQTETV